MTASQSTTPLRTSEAPLIPSIGEAKQFSWSPTFATEQKVFGFNSRDIRSRPFNLLRARVLRAMDERSLRSVGIVSATPGVGKSFVSANLAAALSRVPSRLTYLFDFDLRRSSIAENFGISPEVGLNNYLAGKIDALSPVAHIPEGERLVILPSISDQTSSAELLAGGRCEALCEAFRSLPAGTLCICDLPPAFANDDAAIMSARLDAYLLVVEDGHSTRSQVKETIEMLSADKCIGAVLNNFNGGVISDHYGYGYGQTGKYSAYYGS